MGKKDESGGPEAARMRGGESGSLGDVAENIGERLGNFLNQVEDRWSAVRGQRDAVVKNLRAIRDKANALLVEAGDIELPIPAVFKRRRRQKRPKAKKTAGSAVPPSVKRGRGTAPPKKAGLSAEGRAAAAAAQRAGGMKSARKGRRGDKVGNG